MTDAGAALRKEDPPPFNPWSDDHNHAFGSMSSAELEMLFDDALEEFGRWFPEMYSGTTSTVWFDGIAYLRRFVEGAAQYWTRETPERLPVDPWSEDEFEDDSEDFEPGPPIEWVRGDHYECPHCGGKVGVP